MIKFYYMLTIFQFNLPSFLGHSITFSIQSQQLKQNLLAAQRFALPACGRVWTRSESRKKSKPEKSL
jgi:hypothetical protein